MTTYRIAILPHYYYPDTQGNNAPEFRDADYDSVAKARKAIAKEDAEIYVMQHGESGRPTLLIVDDRVADYVESGRNQDGSNYDWDDCNCRRDAGDCCGECDECYTYMIAQDRAYIHAYALS